MALDLLNGPQGGFQAKGYRTWGVVRVGAPPDPQIVKPVYRSQRFEEVVLFQKFPT
jgi:hypothetical protein